MRFTALFVAVSYVASRVQAGGYPGCVERIAHWEAFEIDGLRPAGSRQVGFKCVSWDRVGKKCNNNHYVECTDAAGNRCGFEDLMRQLDPNSPNVANWKKLDSNGKLDRIQTAKACHDSYINDPNSQKQVRDFQPYRALKGGGMGISRFIIRQGQIVDTVWGTLSAADQQKHRQKFQDFDDSMEEIKRGRRGAIGKDMVPAARSTLKAQINGAVVAIKNLGVNPVSSTGNSWAIVDFPSTEANAIAKSVPNAAGVINSWKQQYFGKYKLAMTHQNIVNCYDTVENNKINCGRP